jgi:hypothetical protein
MRYYIQTRLEAIDKQANATNIIYNAMLKEKEESLNWKIKTLD